MTGAGIKAGKAYVEFVLSDKKLESGLHTLRGTMMKVGAAGLAATGPILAGFAATIGAASDLEETMNKFNVVFGDNAKTVKKWGDDFARQVGRSRKQIAEFMAGTQDLFVPLGFEPGAATDLSKQITGLAIDLASFNNISDGDALRDLHAALTGSGEVMKKYGVIVSEAAVKQELLNMHLDPKFASEQEKVQARLNIILAGTTAAQGDAIRSAGGWANQMKALEGALFDTTAAIGTAILPAVTEFLTQTNSALAIVRDWITANPELVTGIAAVTAGITLASGAGLAFAVVLGIITAHPIVFAITAITGALIALVGYFASTSEEGSLLTKVMDGFLRVFMPAVYWVKEFVEWITGIPSILEKVAYWLGLTGDGAEKLSGSVDSIQPTAAAAEAQAAQAKLATQSQNAKAAMNSTVAGKSAAAAAAPALAAAASVQIAGIDQVINWTKETAERITRLTNRMGGAGMLAGGT